MALWPTSVLCSTLPNMSSRKNVTERERERERQKKNSYASFLGETPISMQQQPIRNTPPPFPVECVSVGMQVVKASS